MKHIPQDQSGFTLIELMVYLSIVTVALLVFTNFMADVTHNASKAKISKEVQQNARLILTKVTQEIRTQKSINEAESVFNSDDGKLVLMHQDGTTKSIFDLAGDDLTFDSGTGIAQTLTNQFVKVTQLNFEKIGDTVSIVLTVEQKRDSSSAYERDAVTLSSTIVPRASLY